MKYKIGDEKMCVVWGRKRWYIKTSNIKPRWMKRSRYKMEKKLGHKIPKGFIVHHKDENSLNDHISNLQLMRRDKHCRYPHYHFGQNHWKNKLTFSEVKKIRKLYKTGFSQESLGFKFNVSQKHIGNIVNFLSRKVR